MAWSPKGSWKKPDLINTVRSMTSNGIRRSHLNNPFHGIWVRSTANLKAARVVRAQRFDDPIVEGVGQQRVGVQHEQCLAFRFGGAGGDGGAAAARGCCGFYVKVRELLFLLLDDGHRVIAASGINHNDLTSTRPAGRLRDAS